MNTLTLYTFGYQHGSAERTLEELVALKTPLLDIRKNPHVGKLEWTKDMLTQESGLQYVWIEALGNDLFEHQNGAIQIHDMDAGLDVLARVLHRSGRACIMCACAKVHGCHRLLVSDEAERRLPGLKVLHLPTTGRGKQDVAAPVFYTVDLEAPGYPVLFLSREKQVKTYQGGAGHCADPGEAKTEFESFYHGVTRCLYVEPDLFQQHVLAGRKAAS